MYCSNMDIQVDLLAESFPTQLTWKVAFLLVNELHVFVQHGLVGAQVVAVMTFERAFRRVHGFQVGFQVDLLAERSAALGAGVRLELVGVFPLHLTLVRSRSARQGGADAAEVRLAVIATAAEVAHLVGGHPLTLMHGPEIIFHQ